MGVLVDVTSGVLRIRRADFGLALQGLRQLAERAPEELIDAAQVLAATDPVEALVAAYWSVAVDSEGDIVGIGTGDKSPSFSSEFWPYAVLAALAPAVRVPAEVYVQWQYDEDEEIVYHVEPDGVTYTYRARVKHPWPPVPDAKDVWLETFSRLNPSMDL